MSKILLGFFGILIFQSVYSQTPTLNCLDITKKLDVLGQATITYENVVDSPETYLIEPTIFDYNTEVAVFGNQIFLGKESISPFIPLGFNFTFFGESYTHFKASSNGFITFADLSSSFPDAQGIPSGNLPNNMVALAWANLDPSGQDAIISYERIGSGGSSRFIIDYHEVPHFLTIDEVTAQIKLFEGSNHIEIHTVTQPSSTEFVTAGIENIDGSQGYAVPGRNGQLWTASNDAHAFKPYIYSLSQSDFDHNDIGGNNVIVEVRDSDNNVLNSCSSIVTIEPLIATQVLTGAATLTCPQNNTLTLQGSELGFDYYLRNDVNHAIVDGPEMGTGNALDFQTGVISETTDFHVFASNPSFALDLDGMDDVVIPHSSDFDFSDGLTIEAWVRPDDITVGNQEIFRKENNAVERILLSFQDNGTILSFGIETSDDGYTELDVPINAADYNGQWVHIVATFDDPTNAMRLYLNGNEIGSKASNGFMETAVSPSNAHIGSSSGVTEFFDGQIAALRIWNTAPSTQTEVDELLLKGQANLFTGLEPGLVAYYAFYEGAGTVLNDVVNDNNGSVNEALWSTGITGGVGSVVSNTLNLVCTVYVDINATGADDGTNWADAFDTIQEGVDAADEEGLILVAEGTYMITDEITIDQPLGIRGGFPTGGGTQDIENHPTIIDAFESTTANRQRVINTSHVSGELYLEGLTLQNGQDLVDGQGGAIRTTGDLNLNQVMISNNNAFSDLTDSFGGAVYSQSADVFISNSHVIDNGLGSSFSASGTIYTENGNVTLVNSLVRGNEVESLSDSATGGAVYTSTGNITLVNSLVNNNQAVSEFSTASGGGLSTGGGQIRVVNSLIADNRAISEEPDPPGGFANGGGIQNTSGNIILINSAVIGNTTTSTLSSNGGGVFGNINMENSLLWGNQISNDGGNGFSPNEHQAGTLQTDHSLIKGMDLTADSGLDASDPGFDPLFTDEMNDDFSLQLGSPLIDAGDFNLLSFDDYDVDGDGDLLERVPLDLAGMTRELGINVEIGPYEFQTEYLVGGMLSGLLAGNEITLQNNAGDDLILTDNGAFAFVTPVAVGANYTVTVLNQPNGPIQPCIVSNSAGSIVDQDITDVVVNCATGDDLIFRDGLD